MSRFLMWAVAAFFASIMLGFGVMTWDDMSHHNPWTAPWTVCAIGLATIALAMVIGAGIFWKLLREHP